MIPLETYATVTTDLVIQTCWCGCAHAVPRGMVDKQRRDQDRGVAQTAIHCPHGHAYVRAGDSRATLLERQLTREKQRHDQTLAELKTARSTIKTVERQRAAAKGEATKLKKRAAGGVCPCCKRTFSSLALHMERMHADFVQEAKSESTGAGP